MERERKAVDKEEKAAVVAFNEARQLREEQQRAKREQIRESRLDSCARKIQLMFLQVRQCVR
jgi:hypothetical protein